MINTKHLVVIALYVAIASVLHIIESWIPLPLPIPGAKLGLANIVSLLVIATYGWRDALYVAILRVLLGSLLGGTLLGPTFIMSMSGALVSTVLMAAVFKYWQPTLSLTGISLLGAVAHNLAQLVAAAGLVNSPGILWYLPYLILFAIPTGVATGITANYFLDRLAKTGFSHQ